MADYKKMYLRLFNELTKTIDILQAAQQEAEELYLSDEAENHLTILNIDPKKTRDTV